MKTCIICLIILASPWLYCVEGQNRETNSSEQLLRSVEKEIACDAAKHKEIVTRIWNGELKSNQAGVVLLPSELTSCSKNGLVYVTKTQDGRVLVLIPTWVGKGTNLRGYLYSQMPFNKTDKHNDSYAGTELAIAVNVPVRTGKINLCEVVIVRELDGKSMYVSRSLD